MHTQNHGLAMHLTLQHTRHAFFLPQNQALDQSLPIAVGIREAAHLKKFGTTVRVVDVGAVCCDGNRRCDLALAGVSILEGAHAWAVR